jgi:hypothetical protein
MEKIKLKIVSYDSVNHSLQVSFASDETQSIDPASYPPVAIQVDNHWSDITDIEELKKKIAIAGIPVIQQQVARESLAANKSRQDFLKGLVGSTFEYDAADIIVPEIINTEAMSPEDHPVIEV